MKNIFFEDEDISENDLYFMCYMVERVARRIHQHNAYVVGHIGGPELMRLISLANVLHSENPEQVDKVPTASQMGKVYKRLIIDTLLPDSDISGPDGPLPPYFVR